jgi:glycosyltransferase involved in cell wall biosynthesis
MPSDIEMIIISLQRTYLASAPQASFARNLEVYNITVSKDTFFYNFRFQLDVCKFLVSKIKKLKPDIIHTHFGHMPDLAWRFLPSSRQTPTIATAHSSITGLKAGVSRSGGNIQECDKAERYVYLLGSILHFVERHYLKTIDKILPVSNWTKRHLSSVFGVPEGKMNVIHNSVDEDLFKPMRSKEVERVKHQYKIDSFSHVISFVGRIYAIKNISRVISFIVPQVLKEHPDSVFVFIGGGNYKRYEKMMPSFNIPKEKCRFMGHKAYAELPKIYAISNVTILPSLFENLPTCILEAMSCSKPVVASNVGGIPEAVKHGYNGLLSSPYDMSSFVEHILKIIEDPSLAMMLGRNGRETVLKKFSWKRNIRKIIDIYKDFCRETR